MGDEESAEPLVITDAVDGKSVEHVTSAMHPHLFTVPLILLVVAHLAHLTRARQTLLAGLDIGAFLGFFIMFGTPFLMRSAPSVMAGSMMVGAGVLTICMGMLCIIPLVAMWRVPPASGSGSRSPAGERAPQST